MDFIIYLAIFIVLLFSVIHAITDSVIDTKDTPKEEETKRPEVKK